MHRYEELERIYYKKLFIKFLIVIGIIALFVSGIFLLKKSKKETQIESKKEMKKEKPKNIDKNKTIKKEYKKTKTEQKKEDKKTQIESKKEVKSFHFILPDISEIKTSKEVKETKPKKEPKKEIKKPKSNKIKEIQINHTANLDIKITEKKANLQTLIKKFNQTEDFNLAILIAKEYLKKRDLKNAQIWALKANNINPSSYKSWILFADILQKEKKIKKAKEILKVYLDSYGQNDIIEQKLRSLNDK